MTTTTIVTGANASRELASPGGKIRVQISTGRDGRLGYRLWRGEATVLERSPIGVTVDGVDYGLGVELGEEHRYRVDETYPWRGVKSQAVNRCNGLRLHIRYGQSKQTWTLEARAYDDGFAWRCIIPGGDVRRITGEATAWNLPAGSVIWYQTSRTNYEGDWIKSPIEAVTPDGGAEGKRPDGMGLPVTVELPGGGFALLTEADVYGYSDMTLKPAGRTVLKGVFEDDPGGWTLAGTVTTPWRITLAVDDLNALVNSDLVHNVCPPPDPVLFPDGVRTAWIKPGRVLWQWWAYDDAGTKWDRQKWFVDRAAELDCPYYLVDAGWENPRFGWTEPGTPGLDSPDNPQFDWHGHNSWKKLKELCDYAAGKGVGILVWRSWKDCGQGPGVSSPEQRRDFFQRCKAAGVKGAKIDYFDSGAHDILDVYEDLTRLGAQYQILVNFHGANKPAGEARTWPCEITREGIKGLEHNKWSTLPRQHYAALPFTRLAVGYGDFTPTTLQEKFLKGTTVTQQLACAVVYTSPLLCWADKPELYLESPALPIVKTLPPVWDETRVLPGSVIGELAAFARRNGRVWYVGIIHGRDQAADYTLDLGFLGRGRYDALFFSDVPDHPAEMRKQEQQVDSRSRIEIHLTRGGGFIGRFVSLGR